MSVTYDNKLITHVYYEYKNVELIIKLSRTCFDKAYVN